MWVYVVIDNEMKSQNNFCKGGVILGPLFLT